MQRVVVLLCVESHRHFYNSTNMRRKPSAYFSLHVGMMPKTYQHELLYQDMPLKFTWNKAKRTWSPRKDKCFCLGRMYYAHPSSGEHFFLCLCKGTSVCFLTSPILPYSPLVHMYFSHTSAPSPGTTLKDRQLSYSKSDNFPEVDSPIIVDFPCPPPLVPQPHRTSLRRIGTCPHDTTAPSAVTWTPIYGRLGDRRLGTVIPCISFVD
jgi:hypothetical protein